MKQNEPKETNLTESIEALLNLSKDLNIPVTIITATSSKQTAVYHSGNILDQATHFMALESLLEENEIPIEVQKMIAVAAAGDPTTVCQCPKCTAKRSVKNERKGESVTQDSINQLVKSLLGGNH